MAEDNDLATVAGVRKYLSDTCFASDHITALLGGFGNFAYRIHLNHPFDGKETFVLKYAAPYVAASGGTMPFPTERQVRHSRYTMIRTGLTLKLMAELRGGSSAPRPQDACQRQYHHSPCCPSL